MDSYIGNAAQRLSNVLDNNKQDCIESTLFDSDSYLFGADALYSISGKLIDQQTLASDRTCFTYPIQRAGLYVVRITTQQDTHTCKVNL